ncbi:hypothetical protein [Shimia sediminis]|uniref:hypothetical protein n=1 Tax=Shimia sediminis TaxID=2497945 RepID=UPI000F8E834D|nr:hypothetical protein [Shimia sediminis]
MTDTDITEVLIQRAKEAGLEVEDREVRYPDEVRTLRYVQIPCGKETRPILVSSNDKAEELQSIEFEKYSFLGDYEAIVDLKIGAIEAALSSRDLMGTSAIRRQLGFSSTFSGDEEVDGEESEEITLQAEGPDGVHLEISNGTKELQVLALRPTMRRQNALSIKLFLNKPLGHDSALHHLETISNSLFFQIDMERGITLSLRKSLRRRRPIRRMASGSDDMASLQFPTYEYDSAPISLYWYAKSARGMPLLQFLAYYQVAEYYFPNFSKLEAVRTARKILKNPTFRVDRESDLTKLISSISGGGRTGSSERDQMKATVAEVLSLDDVREYFDDNEDIAKIVEKKHKGITDKTVNLNRKEHDHRPDIAELLYDIRCRIVHTKNDFETTGSEMLLPFSTAEEDLWAYVDLMQFVARHALIRSSTALRPI